MKPYLISCIKINSKWIKHLNVGQNYKTLRRNQKGKVSGHWISWNDTKNTGNKVKIDKLDYIKIKSFCDSKDKINRVKRQPTERQKIFANNISDKGKISRICKEILQLNNKKIKLKKWVKDLDISPEMPYKRPRSI